MDGRFVAGVFVGVAAKSGGRIFPPISPETADGQRAIKLTCSAHFNNKGGPSCWISVFTRLVLCSFFGSSSAYADTASWRA